MVATKGDLPDEYFVGRTVEIAGVIAPPARLIAPGRFDYRRYLTHQGIYYELKSESAHDWRTLDANTHPPITDRFLAWAQRTLGRGLPEPDEPLRLMWAMTLGWKTALTGEVDEPFMKNGTIISIVSHTTPLLSIVDRSDFPLPVCCGDCFLGVVLRRIFADMQRAPYRLHTIHRDDRADPWQILHPTAADESAQADAGALVRQGEFHGVKLLLLSDLGRAGQDRLLARTNELGAEIVVSGLPTQTDPLCEGLLDAIRPRLIIVADSELPATARASERLRERLARRNVTVLSTRESGAVTISFRAGGCEINTADGQYFKLENLPKPSQLPVPPNCMPAE